MSTVFVRQPVVINLTFPQLLTWRSRCREDDVVGTEFLDLLLSLAGDPLTNRQQPDHAGDSDENAEHRQKRTQRVQQKTLQSDTQVTQQHRHSRWSLSGSPLGVCVRRGCIFPVGDFGGSRNRTQDFVLLDHAVAQADDPSRTCGNFFLVSHHHDRRPVVVQSVEQVEDFVGRGGVQVAGCFIGENELRSVRQTSRDAGSLLLTAGKFVGAMSQSVAQSDFVCQGVAPVAIFLRNTALVRERDFDVLQHGQLLNQVVGLKDEADAAGADCGQLIVTQRRDVLTTEVVLPGRRSIEAAQQVEQRALAGTRRSHDRDIIPDRDIQIDALQHAHGFAAEFVVLAQVANQERRAGRRIRTC